MLTPFGKYLRKLRIDRGHLLKNMADLLKVTSSYLSAVETGKRAVPSEWPQKIASEYGLVAQEEAELVRLAELSAPEFTVDLREGADEQTREAVAMFARRVTSMDNNALAQLISLMQEQESK